MIYKDFKGLSLSYLGFGLMRLPVKEDKSIDEDEFEKMVDYAISHGINYFDTGYPYMGGLSELVIGKILKKYPRDSFYIADKYPGHQIMSKYEPATVFEDQLKKVQVDYFDFYLLHSVSEGSIKTYEDPKWGIVDYFVEQKKLGKIKHLGFSAHGMPDNLDEFLSKYGDVMEFCQIQFNYVDWSLQEANKKLEVLKKYNIPVWVMEPVRGGRLASFDEETEKQLKDYRPNESVAAWAFRYLQKFDQIKVILSGMTYMDQVIDNIKTFEDVNPLNDEETALVYKIASKVISGVPCTACKYCEEGCPMGLNIPNLIKTYNDFKITSGLVPIQYMESLPEEKHPRNCIGCGACATICPQHINIPDVLKELCVLQANAPSWKELSKQREEALKKLKEKAD